MALFFRLEVILCEKHELMILLEEASHSSVPERVHFSKTLISSGPRHSVTFSFCFELTQYPGSGDSKEQAGHWDDTS